jgi:hypothetical protein
VPHIENRWRRILAAAVDGAVVESGAGQTHPDLLVRTRDGRSIGIDVKWAGEGWPQDVRRAARGVPDPWPSEVVVLAHQLSPGAIEWLRERGANWADEAGQARLLGPGGLIVIREPARLPPTERSARTFRWSPSALAVAETILARPRGPLRATELAHVSGWSVPQVANVLKAFDAQGWTVKRGPARGPHAHRALNEPDALLAAWSTGVTQAPRPTRIAHRATRNVLALLREQLAPALDRSAAGWALSGWAGLEIAAPFATATPSLHVHVAASDFAGALSDVIERAGLREVDEGGRVTFWAADARTLALATRRDDVPIVSAPRLFADLTTLGARGQDAADHVKELLIDPLHPRAPSAAEHADG